MPDRAIRDPKTKADFIDRIMSYDFDGDIRHLGVQNAIIHRVRPHVIRLRFPDTGKEFELAVRLPRSEEAKQKMRSKRTKRQAPRRPRQAQQEDQATQH